ncbi:MAG: o-succinylbenzoate--CoA ligase [Bacteroidetes bacterium SB0662_bin_6]|nr:o-succinylbenzoate--CoA ligase [Bacteroidetes bacterium SB0668_bin_1]MYE03853.1 o-succinylbenzoate--CoA ligase [Bacteroidetes bacterium SB0662_bin_6]
MDIPCLLSTAALRAPLETALSGPGVEVPYGELDRLVSGAARRMAEKGVGRGDRIALIMDRSVEAVILLLAAMRAGAVACPISMRLPEATVAGRCRNLGVSLTVGDRPLEAAVAAKDLIERGRGNVPPFSEDAPATIVFTSGSSGAARPALHTYGNHYFSALGAQDNMPLACGDRWLLSLPLWHVGGLAILFRCLLAAATVILPDPADSLAASVRKVTHASMVSTQLRRLLREAESGAVHPEKALLLGGGAVSPVLIDEAVRRGLPVHTSYGLTEMASQVTATPPGAGPVALRTSGRVLPWRELRCDEAGQIMVRGRTCFAGYIEGDRLARPFDEEGWFATGDMGRLDASGRLIVRGRMDHLLISGGENILPEEIEVVLAGVEGVERVVVVGVQDEEYGQRPVAFVGTADGEIDASRLRAAVEAVLPRFMTPDAFYPWPTDLAGEGLKPDRSLLRQRAEALQA